MGHVVLVSGDLAHHEEQAGGQGAHDDEQRDDQAQQRRRVVERVVRGGLGAVRAGVPWNRIGGEKCEKMRKGSGRLERMNDTGAVLTTG